ncbi:CheY-like chemotaxis protein [Silvibacterium bohemicum]|uniref:CheY-like chemotaxis protein n=1 Tax=Silvibacterium bohemicum TaxID=1577686 RepID=A0A841JR34_9BACT|nr:response regulator [Silvibacterium bohemicum]MBB6143786.1 CheY-like chemotaxis protein [Silvibacterium bohemicum]
MMPSAKVKLLIVDDEASLRASLSLIFTTFGHSVRSAEDGFSALVEMRNELPDVLISDLNMPGMSGFEFLSVVRRRFPAIQVIAMSGAFSGDSVPLGVAADVFYEKGSNPGTLLETVQAMAQMERSSIQHPNTPAPIWIPKNGHDPTGAEYVMVTCPECLRTFPQVLDDAAHPICETGCAHCCSLIHYAIVQSADTPSQQALQRKPAARVLAPPGVPNFTACK